jgi:hypothetical protein
MAFKSNHFGSYVAGFTTADDVDAVLRLIESKASLSPSKRDAVYERAHNIISQNVSNGLFCKIERVATNENELEKLGGEKRLIAITGAYLLAVNELGVHTAIPTETAMERQHIRHRAAEIGTTLHIEANDLPNADDKYPKRCFYRPLIAMTTLNLFRLAGQEVGGKKLGFDTITANVQNRPQMRTIMNWLTHGPLDWSMIERPSKELIKATSETTVDDEDFLARDKFFYELFPSSLPVMARYLLDCARTGRVTSDHETLQNTVHMGFDLSTEMVTFLQVIKSSPQYFAKSKRAGLRAGFEDVRRRLPIAPEPEAIFEKQRARPSAAGSPRLQLTPSIASGAR